MQDTWPPVRCFVSASTRRRRVNSRTAPSSRYLAACSYDEPLRIASKLVALGRSSASMEQAMPGADRSIRAISRVAVVRSDGHVTSPWTAAQRAALEAFEGRALPG
jgi:hypothetical protein